MRGMDLDAKFHLDRDLWIVKVPFGLQASHMKRAVAFLRNLWMNEYNSLNSILNADRREFYRRGISALDAGKVRQAIISKGDIALFQSTEKMTTTFYGV